MPVIAAQPYEYSFPSGKLALIVIDMQRDFVEEGGFGSVLGDQLSKLEQTQSSAADASRSLADGTAIDPTQAIIAVERAQLSMQLASQLRTKGVEALQDIFHTQV